MTNAIRNLNLIRLISFFSTLYFYLPILTLYYQSRGLNFVQINSLWGIITGAIFLFEVPTGIIADRIGRKRSIVIALVLQLLGEIIFLFAQNYFHFIFISLIAGLGFAFQSGCLEALVYDSLKDQNKESEMQKTSGSIGAFFQAGHVIGALISSLIVTQLSPERFTMAILLTIVSVFTALIFSFFLHEPARQYAHLEKTPWELLNEAVRLIKGNSSLKRLMLFGLFTTPFIGYLRNFQPPYFLLSNVPSFWFWLSLSGGGVVAIIASKYAYKIEKHLGVERGVFLTTVLPAIFYILMAFIVHPLGAVVLFILNFGAMSLQDPLLADYNNRQIPGHIRATVLSTINMFSSIYITLMGLIIGYIADVSVLYAFLVMGLVVLLGAILFKINESHVQVFKNI